jgi:hypothetical protein
MKAAKKRQMTYKQAKTNLQGSIVPLPPEVLEESRKVVAEYPARHEAYLKRKRNYPTTKDAQWAWNRLHLPMILKGKSAERIINGAKEILSHFEEPIITKKKTPYGTIETIEWKRKRRSKKQKPLVLETAYRSAGKPCFQAWCNNNDNCDCEPYFVFCTRDVWDKLLGGEATAKWVCPDCGKTIEFSVAPPFSAAVVRGWADDAITYEWDDTKDTWVAYESKRGGKSDREYKAEWTKKRIAEGIAPPKLSTKTLSEMDAEWKSEQELAQQEATQEPDWIDSEWIDNIVPIEEW